MALGYENTGIAPRLIANAGNAMTESIRQFGEKLQKDIVSHNTDKQVMGFLSEAKTLNLDSPTFQGDLVGVLAKYPMAAGDQRALMGAKLLAGGWEQKQAQKAATDKFEQQKILAGIRVSGANRPYSGANGFNPDLPALSGPTGEADMFNAGGAILNNLAPAPLGVPFQPTEELPPLPDANPLFNQDLDQTFRRIGVDDRTGRRLMAQDAALRSRAGNKGPTTRTVQGVGLVEFNPTTGEWTTAVEAKTPRRFRSAGDRLIDLDTGEEVAIGVSPNTKANLDMRKTAAAESRANKVTDRALRSLNSEINEKERDITSLEQSIRKRQDKKERTPDENAEMAKWQEQHATLRAERDVLQAERDEMGAVKTSENSERVTVQKDGKKFTLPRSQLEDATKEGYTLVE